MKKFISMLAGVVMASTMFAASAYAENYWSMTVSPTEVEIGDTVTVVLATEAKTLGGDLVKVGYDTDVFEFIDCVDVDDNSYTSEDSEFKFASKNFFAVSHNENAKVVTFSWSSGDGLNKTMKANDEFAFITFKAKAASEGAVFTLFENCALDGADVYNGYVDAEAKTVKVNGAVEPPYEPTWTAASSEWAAPAGKKAIWWPVDFAAGEFDGYVDVTVTNGEDSKTVGVGAANGFNIEGAVSFAVAVILDEAVDATYFDCVVE